jgi:hypothetical protein
MLPSVAIVGSVIVYLAFLCVLGILTGLLIALVSRRRPTRRDMLVDFVLAGTAAVASAMLLTVYQQARGLTSTGAPSLIPIAVGSVALRHVVAMLRRATYSHHSKAR